MVSPIDGAASALSSTGTLLSNPVFKGVLVILLIGIFVYFIFKAVKKVAHILLNSFIGLVLLVGMHFLPAVNAPITIWSVLLVLFGGLLGLVAVVLLQLIGISL